MNKMEKSTFIYLHVLLLTTYPDFRPSPIDHPTQPNPTRKHRKATSTVVETTYYVAAPPPIPFSPPFSLRLLSLLLTLFLNANTDRKANAKRC